VPTFVSGLIIGIDFAPLMISSPLRRRYWAQLPKHYRRRRMTGPDFEKFKTGFLMMTLEEGPVLLT
jgi:hypothetical protein